MTKKVCLVIGAGAGIGGSVGMKFAREGYHAALCRRSDAEGLDKLVSDIEAQGGSASGHLVNAVQEGAIEQLVEEAEQIGPVDVVLFNLGAQIEQYDVHGSYLLRFLHQLFDGALLHRIHKVARGRTSLGLDVTDQLVQSLCVTASTQGGVIPLPGEFHSDAAADAGSRADNQTHFFCHHSLPGVAACQTRIFCCSINCSISASL